MDNTLIITTTEDGSLTIWSSEAGEHYHSIHGALQESLHIFIRAGLEAWLGKHPNQTPHILEVGLGTGLNALLTTLYAEQHKQTIRYTALEKYPLPAKVYQALEYQLPESLDAQQMSNPLLHKLHSSDYWQARQSLSPYLQLRLVQGDLLDLSTLPIEMADIVYFDAFSPESQPELWTQEVFSLLYQRCQPGAILVTYCAKGQVRRNLQGAGFMVERLPGPPGKREILRACKTPLDT